MSILAGKERSIEDWRQLMKNMNSGLRIVRIKADAGSAFGIVELAFDAEKERS